LLLAGAKTREHLNSDREVLETIRKSMIVLLGQNCSGNQYGHLFASLNGLECGSNRDLCVAETNVTANQAIHRLIAGHVVLDILNRPELVRRLFEHERGFQLL